MATDGTQERKDVAALFTPDSFCTATRARRPDGSGSVPEKCINALITDQEESYNDNADYRRDNLCKSHYYFTRNDSIYNVMLQSIRARVYQT